ncbi:HAD family phosphatase [Undibacterium sp. CY18W]|uniref:HAD family phosphatase n=2 Tax=Undibacterium hunanense TaxID=2762292 RepID=A0ABR6ZWD9_9BURK|nr:HAD family phosphatase [Undibacterium hunanense]
MVAFDCDGVLVDSEPITNLVLKDYLNELGWRISLNETCDTFIGRSIKEQMPYMEEKLGKALPETFLPEFQRRRDEALRQQIRVIPEIEQVLKKLQSSAMPFCVASGADSGKMQITLGHTGLLPYFEGRMFSGSDVARTKPAPDVYLLAAKSMAKLPGRCVVIEDTVAGVTAGVAAGMHVLGFTRSSKADALLAAGAKQVFDDMRDLPELIL